MPIVRKDFRKDMAVQRTLIALLGFFALFLTLGVRTSLGVYIDPWEQDFHVARSQISLVSSVSLCVYGLALPVMGKLADSVGPRKILSLGITLTGAGLVGTALSRSLFGLYLFYGIVASLGFAAASNVVTSVAALRWFPEKLGFVQGFMITGMAAGQMVVAPISLFLVELLQWRHTNLLFGFLYLFLFAPLFFFLFQDSPNKDSSPGAVQNTIDPPANKPAWREIVRHPATWLIVFAYFVCGYTDLGFIQTHFVPLVQGLHVDSSFVAVLLSIYAGSNIAGTLLVGYFSDRFRLPYVLAGLYAMRIAGLLFLFLGTFHTYCLIVFAVLFGFTDFAAISPIGSLCANIFGRENLGAVFGTFSTCHQIGAMTGSLLPGLLFDHYHDYMVSIFLAGGLLAASTGCALALSAYARE